MSFSNITVLRDPITSRRSISSRTYIVSSLEQTKLRSMRTRLRFPQPDLPFILFSHRRSFRLLKDCTKPQQPAGSSMCSNPRTHSKDPTSFQCPWRVLRRLQRQLPVRQVSTPRSVEHRSRSCSYSLRTSILD